MAAVVMLAASAAPALAEEVSRGCPEGAALYGGETGIRLWVTRVGSIVKTDPLRPLSHDPAMVLEVVINSRAVTAYGPDPTMLQRGGSPASLEAENHNPIRWRAGLADLPSALRVIAADGAPLIGPLPFASCGDAPKVVAPKLAEPKPGSSRGPGPAGGKARGRSSPGSAPTPSAPPGLHIPEGAVGPGLMNGRP